jgi:hypothetical protein
MAAPAAQEVEVAAAGLAPPQGLAGRAPLARQGLAVPVTAGTAAVTG